MDYSVIVPALNEQDNINECYNRLSNVLNEFDYELIFVDDGSSDNTLQVLQQLASNDSRVKVISFSKNFGHQNAVVAGMRHSCGDAVVIMDCDMQDPPEIILQMIQKFKQGYDIVYGKRQKRKGEGWFKKLSAYAYYRILGLFDDSTVQDVGDFRLISRRVADRICSLPEHNKYLRGINSWVGYKQAEVIYERQPRHKGKTNYTLTKMTDLAIRGAVSTSKKPLALPLKFGFLVCSLALAAVLAIAVIQILFWCGAIGLSVKFEFFATAVLALIGGGILVGVGINGMYIAQIYDDTRNRPEYIIEQTINIEKK